jgi:hypothetical protein
MKVSPRPFEQSPIRRIGDNLSAGGFSELSPQSYPQKLRELL